MRAMVLASMIVVAPASTRAQERGEAVLVCPRDASQIPQVLEGWRSPAQLTSARQGIGPTILIGKAYEVALHPDAELKLPNLPGPIKDRVGRGGTMNFSVARAGIYHVALSSGVWVDIVRHGKALGSLAHGHGPACSGVAKVVDFKLERGRYTLTLDGSEKERTSVLLAYARPST